MPRLIDADALKEELAKRTPHFAQRIEFTPCFEAIRDAPTVDVVEVVRCKDCKHRDPEDGKCDCGHDILWQQPSGDDWYCADGVRSEKWQSKK